MMDPQDAPDIRLLWKKTPKARIVHQCDRCGEEIAIGEKYESVGLIYDGEFQIEKKHFGSDHALSGCPKIRARECAEAQAQYESDRAWYNGDGR